jgi:hypothetical protein
MSPRFSTPFVLIAILGFAPSAAIAGPCTKQIAAFEQAVKASGKKPDAGPTGRETAGAMLGHQPTPESVKRAEQQATESFDQALARAKRLDARGSRTCAQALARAKDLFDLQ